MSDLADKIRKFKNRLFYGSDTSPLDYKDNKQLTPDPTIQLNIDGENDNLSNDPFYGDEAMKRRKQTNV